MAMIQFKDEIHNIVITRRMFPPKKVTSIEHWLKKAGKTIPQIPLNTHRVLVTTVTVKWITWELTSDSGERCYVVIDRQAPSIG